MDTLVINGQPYQYISNYKEHSTLRQKFNQLTQSIYGFDFEGWYQNGYWGHAYIPYSLLHNGEMVSSISVNLIDFWFEGQKKKCVQIGTVMTSMQARKRGLSRALLNLVLEQWRGKCDFVCLFANQTVLDFYPKFGFKRFEQYQCSKFIEPLNSECKVVITQLDMSSKTERENLVRRIDQSAVFARLSMVNNSSLIMFYCQSFYSDNVYYIEHLDAIVIAEFRQDSVCLKDVFCTQIHELDDIVRALCNERIRHVILEFTPNNTSSYLQKKCVEGDVLFVLDDKDYIFQHHQLMFPILSHA